MDPQILRDFEKLHSCKVSVDLYEDNEALIAKLDAGGNSLYDVIVPSDFVIGILTAKQLLAPLRHENIPNLKNIAPRFVNPPYDGGNTYTVPYQWGTVGIVMRRAASEQIDETWGLFLDPAKQPGAFVLMDSMRDTFAMALKFNGHSINSTDPEQLKAAAKLLFATKRRALGFDSGVGGKNKVLGRTARLAISYNGDAVRGIKEDPELTYFIPKEGSSIWVDNLAIPSQAPHRDLAEKFINYLLEPEVGARLSSFTQFATPNKESLPLINAEDRNNRAIYPTEDILAKLEFVQDLGPAMQIYDELWTEVKAN